MTGFAPIDMVLAILALILILRGFVRGFVEEFFSLGAVVFGLMASFLLYKNGAAFLRENYLDIKLLPEVLAFIVIFAVIYLLCKIVRKFVSDIIEGLHLKPIDKMLGGIFGLMEGIIAIAIVLFVIYIQPVFDPSPLLGESYFAQIILPFIIDASMEKIKITPNSAAVFMSGFLG